EDLDLPDVLLAAAREVGAGEVGEVLDRVQHRRALIVEIEEILQLREAVSLAQRLDGVIGELDPVAPGKRQHHLRLQRAFDVEVQLAFRQLRDEAAGIGHRSAAAPSPGSLSLATLSRGAGEGIWRRRHCYEGSLPSMPSASQFMPSTSLSGSTSPSFTLS